MKLEISIERMSFQPVVMGPSASHMKIRLDFLTYPILPLILVRLKASVKIKILRFLGTQ